mmetsp:Transcript_20209/g.58440  ORF Transcript_20209/g.58440 Transcript_20209/m.58440 type:complete len:550 (-) Transcript_20209:420-2069(-)
MNQLFLAGAAGANRSAAMQSATAAASTASSACTVAARCLLYHPAVPLKLVGARSAASTPWSHIAARRYHASSAASAAAVVAQRQADCVARIYARRVLELAALAAASRVNKASLEAIVKPEEWGTVDLEQQRKEFGESISSLGKTKIERLWAAGSRIANLAALASPLTVLVPLAYLTGPESKPSHYAWEYAIWSIEKAGPTFIKLIQWATTRNDLFSAEFISKFSRLQDETRGHSWRETEHILKDSFGPNYSDFLVFYDSEDGDPSERRSDRRSKRDGDIHPIGSGCVAQVYRAKLKRGTALHPAGTDVAVKVTHPNILHKVCVDFYIMNKLTSLLESIPRLDLDYLSMKDSVDQFRDIMLPQLDLRVEARNLKRFRRDFEGDKQVTFPTPLQDLTTRQVLVESFVHGVPIMEFHKKSSKEDSQELATIGLETVMKMIFMHDFVHGDLHPGNILIDRNTEARGKPLRMNMIDCGLVVEMGESDHVNLVKILGALVKKDGLLAGQLMVDTAKKCQASELDVHLFCQGIEKICRDDEENVSCHAPPSPYRAC